LRAAKRPRARYILRPAQAAIVAVHAEAAVEGYAGRPSRHERIQPSRPAGSQITA